MLGMDEWNASQGGCTKEYQPLSLPTCDSVRNTLVRQGFVHSNTLRQLIHSEVVVKIESTVGVKSCANRLTSPKVRQTASTRTGMSCARSIRQASGSSGYPEIFVRFGGCGARI